MVSEKTIYRMLDKGLLPALRIGAQWRFRKRDIDGWLDERVKKVEVEGQKAVLEELAPSEIDIHPLLLPENVWLGVPPMPRDELLSWIVTHATLEPGVDRQALYESIRARELVCSTALVEDAAFPHPNEPADFRFSRKRILLAVVREPVNFHDPNGNRPRVIVRHPRPDDPGISPHDLARGEALRERLPDRPHHGKLRRRRGHRLHS